MESKAARDRRTLPSNTGSIVHGDDNNEWSSKTEGETQGLVARNYRFSVYLSSWNATTPAASVTAVTASGVAAKYYNAHGEGRSSRFP